MLVSLFDKIIGYAKPEYKEVKEPELLLKRDGVDVVDLEEFAANRRDYRAAFRTKSLDGFVGYFNKKDNRADALVTIDPDNFRASATFDSVDLGHCRDTATLDVKLSNDFKAYRSILSPECFSQVAAIEFFENHAHNIDGAQKIISGLRKLEVKADASNIQEEAINRSSSSIMSNIELKGSELPTDFNFTFKPFVGLENFSGNIRLRVRVDCKPFKIIMSAVAGDVLLDAIADKYRSELEVRLEHDDVYVGTVSF